MNWKLSRRPRDCVRCDVRYQPTSNGQKYCASCRGLAYRELSRVLRRRAYWRHREESIADVRSWQAKNSERYHRSRREYESRKLKRAIPLVIGHYSNGRFECACCGQKERDFLTIDHIKGGGNRDSSELGIPRGGSSLYRWLIRNGYPPGFQVLCINCNLSKAKHGACIHQMKTG